MRKETEHLDKDLRSIQEVRDLLKQAREAQRILAGMTQEQLDKITAAVSAAAAEQVLRRLAGKIRAAGSEPERHL